MVQGKWLMYQMWAHCINKNHPLLESPLVDNVVLHYAVSYYPTLRHLYLGGKLNDEGVCGHNNTSTLHSYQVIKRVRRGMTIKLLFFV